MPFYERVIKVKADVAALLTKVVTWGAVKGVPQGTFIWTLDSSAGHFMLELGTK
jgi:hypothetical protein